MTKPTSVLSALAQRTPEPAISWLMKLTLNSTRRKPNCEMRLSFGGATERDIREGIARLGAAIEEMI